jgi:hypothetical protein
MAEGPGKYGDIAHLAMILSEGKAVIVMVFDGQYGSGFSVAAQEGITPNIPKILRETADQIEKDLVTKSGATRQAETCATCQGSGYGGHPDSGALCPHCNGTGEVQSGATDVMRAERDEAYGYATRFLAAFCENNSLRHVKPLPTIGGVLTQIDNATTVIGAERAKLEATLRKIAHGREVRRGDHTEMEDIADPSGVAQACLDDLAQRIATSSEPSRD